MLDASLRESPNGFESLKVILIFRKGIHSLTSTVRRAAPAPTRWRVAFLSSTEDCAPSCVRLTIGGLNPNRRRTISEALVRAISWRKGKQVAGWRVVAQREAGVVELSSCQIFKQLQSPAERY
jgi:hypothetical protein